MKHIIFSILICCFLVSCGTRKKVVTKKKNEKNKTEQVSTKNNKVEPKEETTNRTPKPKVKTSVTNYIEAYAEIAKSEMRSSKIPASITLTQGILESGSGNGRLAVEANNHFGIKCHGWQGAKIYHDDDRAQECFRKYKKASSSYEDHSEFLTSRKRYAGLFKLKQDDYVGWARGLKKAGYATDKKYPQKLISLIQRYQLYKYDRAVLGKSNVVSDSKHIVNQRYVIVKGDTLYSLSKRYNTSVDAIKRLNNMTSNDLTIGQEIKIPN